MQRCAWAEKTPLETKYHDTEWGVPVHDDVQLFEMLSLESAQSGLSWATILAKREGYRAAFLGFNIAKVAKFDDAKIEALLQDAGIVRHRQKIAATINNAARIQEVQKEFASFAAYIWSFTAGQRIQNHWPSVADVPSKTALSERMSRDMKKRGFKFIGSTTCYAFIQAIGMVNDHVTDCFRHAQV
ncbi:MAG: DNA-3-methyladenine glycosylase I [Gammaproteobacteria bacterium]|nr:MAG: DNA-3-methyladenine glycosylase I [Gammaproteobacteria bacterium]